VILYLETSRLVKLYFDEDGSAETRGLVAAADVTAVSIVAYAEARATFARKRIEQRIEDDAFKRAREDFERDWSRTYILEATDRIIRSAGDLAEKHGLRGFDAIHLASALALRLPQRALGPFRPPRPEGPPADGGPAIVFCTADKRLAAAGRAEGL
jgi:predicted nucleic acid-binding protein